MGKVESNARPKPYAVRIQAANQRFKSRKSFLYCTSLLVSSSEETRLELWKDWLRVSPPETGPKYRAS